MEVIERFHTTMPILGVCLGHQAICQSFGARIIRAPRAIHGKSSCIQYESTPLFADLPNPFHAARVSFTSCILCRLSDSLRIVGQCDAIPESMQTSDMDPAWRVPLIMAVQHRSYPVFGVQFHPESILSDVGYRILANFLKIAGLKTVDPLPTPDFASSDVWSSFHHSADTPDGSRPLAVLPKAN